MSDPNDALKALADAPVRRIPVGAEYAPTHVLLVDIAQLLIEILAELKRANSVERTGAVSSVSVETNSRGVVVGLKRYTGSEPEVMEALDDYGRLFREAERRALQQWADTVATLAEGERQA